MEGCGRIDSWVPPQILHNIGKERLELVNSMAPYVTAKVLPILKDTTTCWQPADYLPKPESETFLDEVRAPPHGLVTCSAATSPQRTYREPI